MNLIKDILDFIRQLLGWWFIVEPWEQAVRVRFGANVKLFCAGIHFRIPFFDVLYIQNVRRRLTGLPVQTLMTRDLKAITVHGSIGYRIADVLKLQQTLHDAEASVQQEVAGAIAAYIGSHDKTDCAAEKLAEHVAKQLNLERYGLSDVELFLTGYVSDLKTYRLIQDGMSPYTSNSGSSLSTQKSNKDTALR